MKCLVAVIFILFVVFILFAVFIPSVINHIKHNQNKYRNKINRNDNDNNRNDNGNNRNNRNNNNYRDKINNDNNDNNNGNNNGNNNNSNNGKINTESKNINEQNEKNKNNDISEQNDKDIEQVLPHLYIGSLNAISNSLLDKYNIQYILDATPTPDIILENRKIEYKQIPVHDSTHANIMNYFNESNSFIDQALSNGENILVHCREGVSRSATLMAAYLIWKYHISVDEALVIIKQHRPQANPNPGFVNQLLQWEKIVNHGGGGSSNINNSNTSNNANSNNINNSNINNNSY